MIDPIAWDIPRIFAGLLMLSLVPWSLALDWRSPMMRTFALFMLFRGLLNILLPFSLETPQQGATLDAVTAYVGYLHIAVPFIAAALAVRLLAHEAPRRAWLLALLAMTFVLEVAYFFDHSLIWGPAGGASGPLAVTIGLGTLAYMAIAHVLLARARDRTTLVAGISYTLFPLFAAGVELGVLGFLSDSGGLAQRSTMTWLGVLTRVLALLYGIFLAAWLVHHRGGRVAWWGVLAMAASFVVGLLPLLVADPGTAMFWRLQSVGNGLLTAAMPIAIAWALTHERLFKVAHLVHLRMGHAMALLAITWCLVMGALYLGVLGFRSTAIGVGAAAVALLVFLLLQSPAFGVARQSSSEHAPLEP